MSELALKLIRENIEKHKRGEDASFLDLGNCGLTEIPEEIGACTWLEFLTFSSQLYVWNEQKYEKRTTQNQGARNQIIRLPDALARLTNLKGLEVNGDSDQSNDLLEISPVSHLVNLKIFNCSYTKVSDLSPLAKLTDLQQLDCGDTQVSDLTSLAKLTDLQILDCGSTKVSDLSPLANLTNLLMFDCRGTRVSDLSPLAKLTDLRGLFCNSTQVSDLSPLAKLTDLKILDCGSTQVSDLSPLAKLTDLRILDCGSTQVSDLSPLAKLTDLRELFCGNSQVSDLSPLAKLTDLRGLFCGNSQVSDLSPLGELVNVQKLDCSSRQVTDLSPLSTLVNLRELDCSNTQVRDLSPLGELVNVEKLDCSSSQVTDLSPLSTLVNLRELDCSFTRVTDLSPLAKLGNLQNLNCIETQITDLSPLAKLTNLQKLYCSGCQVTDLSPLAKLTNLQKLYCSGCQVMDLSPLTKLNDLQELDCNYTRVTDLSPLAKLIKLQNLDCTDTQIKDLSPLTKLANLQNLYCSGCQVTDLSPLAKLDNLRELFCSNTPITDLSPLASLVNIRTIDCSETHVHSIAPLLPLIIEKKDIKWSREMSISINDINDIFEGRGAILVYNCPLVVPPVEFARESPQAVRDYFEELGNDGDKLNEVKVIFLGEASAGKTSLVKRLLGEKFDSMESQTHGIRIRKAPFAMHDGDVVTAHLWDFGGQEVMHATHQFFLSQRSIYVLLLNSRNDDQAEKWLKHAASFGGNSPVLVVLNKIDENPSFQVDNRRLKEKYPQIRDFFRISAKTDKGIDEFREALRREIDAAPTRRTPFPAHWLEVKKHFSDMEADYIESSEYREVCDRLGVTRRFSQDVLLQFLHDLGVVINFRNLKHFDTQILNPLWLTNGVYRIVNSELVADAGGILRETDFDAVINDPRYKQGNTTDRVFEYPKNKLQYIVRVMEEFELCFALDARTYVVPQLLPVQEPEFKAEGALLRFVIHFPDFMPDSLFPRLMVKLHTFISGDQRWRTGMVLHKPSVFQALARVRWDKEDQKILIDVCGDERRRLLSFIRETVREITEDFTNLNFDELVPVPDADDFFEYQYLVEAEKAGEENIFVKQLKKRIPISDLLDGVEEATMRDETEQLPVKAFVSYAHKDLEYLKELRNALSTLVRLRKLQIWDDRDINVGDEWEKVIFQQLEEADIVICLVSADFVASDFCYKKEFGAALEAHQKGEKTIVPVMLRKTDWSGLPLAKIQGTPGDWITSTANKDDAWSKVSESLRPALEKAKQRIKAVRDKQKMR